MSLVLAAFQDTDPGRVVSTSLHTLGAIGMLGGLVGYLLWVRALRTTGPQPGLLRGSLVLSYISVVTNLLGGFLRTYQAGHPHLTQFGESPWVQVITIKHVFIFGGMAALLGLHHFIAPRLVRLHREGKLRRVMPGTHSLGVFVVGLGILVSTLLGALSTVTPLLSTEAVPVEMEPTGDGISFQTSGSLTANPIAGGEQTGTFRVPAGMGHLQARLTWGDTQYALELDLTDPTGNTTSGSGGGTARLVELSDPAPGQWRFSVTADLAIAADWELEVVVSPGHPAGHQA